MSLFPKKNNTRLSIKARLDSEKSIADFATSSDDTYISILANNCNDFTIYNNSNAGVFGARGIVTENGTKYDTYIGIKNNNNIEKIAVFNEDTISLNKNTIITGDIIPSSNIIYNLGTPQNRWKDLYLSGDTISLGETKLKSSSETGSFVISDANNKPLALESGEMKIIGETGKNIIIKSKDNNLFANTVDAITGELIRELNVTEMNTDTMVEGSNLFYTSSRVANIINASNIHTCNYIENTSNKISNRITLQDKNLSNYITKTSNQIENRLTTTKNIIEKNITDTSNEISTRITLLSTDQITEQFGANNRFIVDNKYIGDIEITGELRTSNLIVQGTTTTIETDKYTAEVLNINSLADYEQSALSVNKTGDQNAKTTIFSTTYNDQLVAYINTDGTLFASNLVGDGSKIRHVRLADNFTDELAEGNNNLYFTHGRVATIIDGSNVHTCNYIKNTSNEISARITSTSNLIEGRLTDTSNKIEGRLTTTSNLIEGRLTDTSNKIEGRLTTTSNLIEGRLTTTSNLIEGRLTDTSNKIEGRLTTTSNLIEARLTTTSNLIEGRLTNTSNKIEGRLTTTSNLIEGRLTDTSNKIEGRLTDTSNAIEGRLTDTSNKIEGRLTDTSNAIEGRLTETSNLIEGRLTDTSNEISTRITLLSTDQITEQSGANNRFIVNDKYIGDVYITGALRASNLLIDGTTTTIQTDNYTAEVLNIESIDNYEQSALSVNKLGDINTVTNILETSYNDKIVARIDTEGIVYASNFSGDGSMIRHVRLADNTTDELTEGNNNLYFTHSRVATIIDGSNVHTCNYIANTSKQLNDRIKDTSNAIEGRLTETSNKIEERITYTSNMIESRFTTENNVFDLRLTETSNVIEGRLTETSNKIEERITYTSNMIESRLATENNTFDLRLTETSNAIESRITLTDLTINNRIGSLTFDEIELGTSNKFIRNNIWNDNLYVAGKLIVAGLEIQELHEIYATEGTGNIGNFQNYIKNQVTNNLKQNLGDIITNNINNASNISANYISANDIFANDISANNLALSGDIIPTQNEVYDLGSAEFKFKDLYLSGNTINLGDTKISSSATDNSLSIKDSSGNLKAIQASEIELRDPSTNKKIRIKTNANNKISFVGVNDSGVEETVKSENDVWNTNDTNIQYQNVKVYSDQITITKDGIENNVATMNDINNNSFWQLKDSNIVYGDLIAYENSIKIADKLPVVPTIVDNGVNISKEQIIKHGQQNMYIFKNQGINSIQFPVPVNGAALIVGGGGAGGVDIGGGGGGGNVIYGSNLQFPSNIVFNIDVGKGGEQPSENGGDSSAFGVIVKGGTGGVSSAMFPLVTKMVNGRKIAYNAYIDEFGKCWVLDHSKNSEDMYFYKQITQVSYDGVNIVDINFKITEISDFPTYSNAGGNPMFQRSFVFINELGESFLCGNDAYVFGGNGNTYLSIPRKITMYNFKWVKAFTTHRLGALINEFGELYVYSQEYHHSPYLYNFSTGTRTGLQKISYVNINEVKTAIDFKIIDVSVVPNNIAFVTDTGDLYIGGNSGGGVFGQPTLYREGAKYPFSKVTKAYWDGELRDINFKITSVSLGAPNNVGSRNYGGFINEFGELFTCGGSGQYNSTMQGNNQYYYETGHGTNEPIIYFTKVDKAYWDGALRTIDFKITQLQYSDQWYGIFLNEFGEVFSWGKSTEQKGWYGIASNTTNYPLKLTKGTTDGTNYTNLPPMKRISRGTIGWNLLSLTEEIWAVGIDRGFRANTWHYQSGARLLLPAPQNDFKNVFLPDIIYGKYETLSFSLNTKILNTTGNVALFNIENSEEDRILATWNNETKLFEFSINNTSITLPNYDIIDTDVHILWTMTKTSANIATWIIYINNVLAIEVDNVVFPLSSNFVSRFIGKSNDINTVSLEGTIYDIRVYNRALSSYERNLLLQKVFDDVSTGGNVLYETSIESDNILQITNDDSLNFMEYTGGKGGFTSSFSSNNIVLYYAGAGGGVLSDAIDATDTEYSLYGDGVTNNLFDGTYGIGGGGGSTLYSGYAGGQGTGEYLSDIGGNALPNTGNGGGGSKSGIYTSGKGGSGVVAVMWYDADYERTMVTCDTDIVSNKVVISNNKGIAFSSVTDVELNYLSGTLSPIQTQLNNLSAFKKMGTGIDEYAKYGNVNIYENKITIDDIYTDPFEHPIIHNSTGNDISNNKTLIDTSNYYYAFSSPGEYSMTFPKNTVCDVLIVGGGGGSSSNSGGASAGGVLYATDITIPANTYSLTVGAGGISDGIIGSNGGFSEAFGARAVGGIASTSNFGASGFGENITGTLLSSFVNNEIAQNGGTKFEISGIFAPSEETEALDNSDYIYYSFTESGTYDITFNKNTECDVLVVGAGGAGSSNYGGGSSGGLVYATGLNVSANTYSMTVGKGGIIDLSEEGGYSEVFGIRAVGGLPISSNLVLEQSYNIVSVENEFSGTITSNLVPSIDYGIDLVYNAYIFGDILKYPSAYLSTNSITTISGQTYGNGEYTVLWSSDMNGGGVYDYPATLLFRGLANSSPGWHTINTNSPDYAFNTDDGYVRSGRYLVEDYLGEWVRLKLPNAIYLSHIMMYLQYTSNRNPRNYRIYGTNDNGANWNMIYDITDVEYSTDKIYTSEKFNFTDSAYNEFGIVFNRVYGNEGLINFNQLEFYGSETLQTTSDMTLNADKTFTVKSIKNTYTETIINDTFLENSGTLGTSYNLTNYGAIQQTSNVATKGEYASLNKTYLQTNSNIDTSQLNAVSVAFWMQLSELNLNSDTVLINDASVSSEIFKIQRNGTTDYWSIECMGGIFTTDGVLNDWVVDNTWNHYIFVFDNDNGSTRLNMYKNGISVFTNTNGTWSSTLIAKPILGHSEQDSSLIGNIDELRLYDRVLTVDEVSELYTYVPGTMVGSEPTTVATFGDVTTDMLAWYKFDSDIKDSSGNGNDLTGGTGTSFVEGKIGTNSISFPKTTTQGLTSSVDLSGNKSFTISLWSYRNSDMIAQFMISAGDSYSDHRLLGIGYTGDNKFYFGFWSSESLYTEPLQDQNTWVHWTMIYDSDNKIKHLYKNGMLFKSTEHTIATNIPATKNNFRIGTRLDASPFDGKIDDVRVYNRALTVDEVSELYNYVPGAVGTTTTSGSVISYNVVYDDLPNTWQEMETIATNNSGRLPTKTEMDDYVSGVNNGTITTKPHEQYASDAAQHSVWFAISDDGLSGYTTIIRPFYRITDNSGVLTGEVHNNGANPGTVNDGNNNIFKWVWYITESGTQNTSTPTITGTYNTDSFLSLDDNETYEYVQFTDNGTIQFHKDTVCDILIVGGGGSGNTGKGGGSSGGMLYAVNQLIPSGTYPITVGAGGVNGNGGDSVAFGATAKGGLQAITARGATNNGANIPGTTIAVWEQNKVALDGGIPFIEYTPVRKYPPTGLIGGTVSGNTITKIPGGTFGTTPYTYGEGEYIITWSSSDSEYHGDLSLDGITGEVGWISDKKYDETTGVSTDTTSYLGSDSDNHGEFIKINLPTSIYLSSVNIFARKTYDPFLHRAPLKYVVYGSKDGVDWTLLIDKTSGNPSYADLYTDYKTSSSPESEVSIAYSYFGFVFTQISGGNIGDIGIAEIEIYGKEDILSGVSGGGGVGSVGGSATTTTDTPNGGDGFPVSIITPNELYAGGGGANGGERVPPSGYTIGYGGNSSETTAGDGGSGVVIIRWKKYVDFPPFGDTIENLLLWYNFNNKITTNVTQLLIGGSGINSSLISSTYGADGTNGVNIPITGDTNVYYGGGGSGYNITSNLSGTPGFGDIGRGGNGSLIPTNGNDGGIIIRVPKISNDPIIIFGGGGGTLQNGISPNSLTSIPNGGEGLSLPITGTFINYAGGGGGTSTETNGDRVPSDATYGYGANSTLTSGFNGGDGIIIIKWRDNDNIIPLKHKVITEGDLTGTGILKSSEVTIFNFSKILYRSNTITNGYFKTFEISIHSISTGALLFSGVIYRNYNVYKVPVSIDYTMMFSFYILSDISTTTDSISFKNSTIYFENNDVCRLSPDNDDMITISSK